MQGGIGNRVVVEGAPVVGNPQHQGHAAALGIVAEEVDEPFPFVQHRLAVGEAEAPERDERLAPVLEIRAVLSAIDPSRADEPPPVLHDRLDLAGTDPAEVVHEGPAAPVFRRGGLGEIEDAVHRFAEARITRRHREALEEDAVDPVFPHPAEVHPHDRLAAELKTSAVEPSGCRNGVGNRSSAGSSETSGHISMCELPGSNFPFTA